MAVGLSALLYHCPSEVGKPRWLSCSRPSGGWLMMATILLWLVPGTSAMGGSASGPSSAEAVLGQLLIAAGGPAGAIALLAGRVGWQTLRQLAGSAGADAEAEPKANSPMLPPGLAITRGARMLTDTPRSSGTGRTRSRLVGTPCDSDAPPPRDRRTARSRAWAENRQRLEEAGQRLRTVPARAYACVAFGQGLRRVLARARSRLQSASAAAIRLQPLCIRFVERLRSRAE